MLFMEISDFAALSATLAASELVAGAYTRPLLILALSRFRHRTHPKHPITSPDTC